MKWQSFSFFFYDLETSGLSPKADRIMQFAGQRTDENLNLIGEPYNILVKLNEDTLPSIEAVLTTKITPQKTKEGVSEAEFAKLLIDEIFVENTCAVGFNSVRFDDEFIRYLLWRNFFDPYEWQWKDGRSRWDILDLVRMTRALRPTGINWPVDAEGNANNRLENITKINNISHEHAHDALSDVMATIAVARLIKERQPKLFNYLFSIRQKNSLKNIIDPKNLKPLVYTSGALPKEYGHTTVVYPFATGRNQDVLVFDLRYNLDELLLKLPEKWFPIVKNISLNQCPAIAPVSVLEQDEGWKKIGLEPELVRKNLEIFLAHPEFMDMQQAEATKEIEWPKAPDPESALYEGFLNERDRLHVEAVRNADENRLADFHPDFADPRLPDLLLHYKARNFPDSLSSDEAIKFEKYRQERLNGQAEIFLDKLNTYRQPDPKTGELKLSSEDKFILDELELWYQSLLPEDY